MYRVRDLGIFSPKWHVSIKSTPPPRAMGTQQRRKQKDCTSQWRQKTPRKLLLDTTKLTQEAETVAADTGSESPSVKIG